MKLKLTSMTVLSLLSINGYSNDSIKCASQEPNTFYNYNGKMYFVADNANLRKKVSEGYQYICTTHVTNMNLVFSRFKGTLNQDISKWDTSNVTSMARMFADYKEFTGKSSNEDISNWDVSNVENFEIMFAGASKFNGNLSKWNTNKAKYMGMMFEDASAFNNNISSWNTPNVKNMDTMFAGAKVFNQDLSKWNVDEVESAIDFSKFSNLEEKKKPRFKL